jgi:hypothetical protein
VSVPDPNGNNFDEIWRLWDKWNMRSTLNAVGDNLIQTQNTSEANVVKLLTGGFQEEAEARNKWHRATLSQAQLSSWFMGYTEIVAIREKVKKCGGSAFTFRNFNEQFLSCGSAPVKCIRRLMLRR